MCECKQLHKNMRIKFIITVSDCGTSKNLSTATIQKFIINKPDGSVIVEDASFVSDGSDGKFFYITEDLDQAGIYNYQMYLEYNGNKIYSTVSSFRVYDNITNIG